MQEIFRRKDVISAADVDKNHHSIFTKSRAEQINSSNLLDAKREKAEKLFKEHSLFASGKVAPDAK